MTTTTDAPLDHLPGCPADRTETTEHPHVTTVRCLDCGAHHPPAPAVTGPFADQEPWSNGVEMNRATSSPSASTWPAFPTGDDAA